MDLHNLLAFLLCAVALTVVPGPDIIFVTTQSLTNGRTSGIFTAMGMCTGVIIHATLAAVGLSAVLRQSAVAFAIVKYAGAAYMFYLAFDAFRSACRAPRATEAKAPVPARTFPSLYRQGFLMNILNPKVALFFLTLLPQFVTVRGWPNYLQMIVLGGVFMVQALIIFSLVAVCSGFVGEKLLHKPGMGRITAIAKGVIFALIGLFLLLGA